MSKIEIEDFGASLADEIKKISINIRSTRLNDNALVVLLSDKSGVSRKDIRKVLITVRGLDQFYLKEEPAPTGYIGAIKTIEIFELPKNGDTIVTTVKVLHEFMGVTLVDISSSVNDKEIARGQMKTVLAT